MKSAPLNVPPKHALLLVIPALLALLPLAGCGRPASAKEPGRFYGSYWDGFSLKFPEGWEIKEKFEGTRVAALAPRKGEKDWYQENICVLYERIPSKVSTDEYMNLSVQYMYQMMPGVKIGKQGETEIDGREARWLTFSHSIGPYKLKGVGYVVIKGNRAYVIVCNTTSKAYSKYKDEFDEVAQSFRFE